MIPILTGDLLEKAKQQSSEVQEEKSALETQLSGSLVLVDQLKAAATEQASLHEALTAKCHSFQQELIQLQQSTLVNSSVLEIESELLLEKQRLQATEAQLQQLQEVLREKAEVVVQLESQLIELKSSAQAEQDRLSLINNELQTQLLDCNQRNEQIVKELQEQHSVTITAILYYFLNTPFSFTRFISTQNSGAVTIKRSN